MSTKDEMSPKEIKIVEAIKQRVKEQMMSETTGHDWWHIERVFNMARRIAKEEGVRVNMFVIDLASLLHDIADWKFHDGNESIGPQKARDILQEYHLDEIVITHVTSIISEISFKGAGVASKMESVEGKIVQDADRLDALGAIGIARTFAYGGYKGIPIYDSRYKPTLHASFEEYKKGSKSTINHFHEKLLLLKNRMNTKTGKKIAGERHQFMHTFLSRFYSEWNGLS